MNHLDISKYSYFSELPLEQFNNYKISVYVIDKNWNYLFVNDFVKKNLGKKGEDLIAKNMWEEFKELSTNPSFLSLKKNSENGLPTNIFTTSVLCETNDTNPATGFIRFGLYNWIYGLFSLRTILLIVTAAVWLYVIPFPP